MKFGCFILLLVFFAPLKGHSTKFCAEILKILGRVERGMEFDEDAAREAVSTLKSQLPKGEEWEDYRYGESGEPIAPQVLKGREVVGVRFDSEDSKIIHTFAGTVLRTEVHGIWLKAIIRTTDGETIEVPLDRGRIPAFMVKGPLLTENALPLGRVERGMEFHEGAAREAVRALKSQLPKDEEWEDYRYGESGEPIAPQVLKGREVVGVRFDVEDSKIVHTFAGTVLRTEAHGIWLKAIVRTTDGETIEVRLDQGMTPAFMVKGP